MINYSKLRLILIFVESQGDARNFRSQSANFEWYGDDDLDLYRWNYQPRSRESKGDFDALFELLKVMNYQINSSDTDESANLSYETSISKHINVEQWLRMLATRVVVSDWDFVVDKTLMFIVQEK